MAAAGDQASSTLEVDLYLSKGCLCARESYAQAAHNGPLLFSLSEQPICCGSGPDRLLRDANETPLLHYVEKGNKRVEVYKGDAGDGGPLAFTVKKPSIFSQTFHIFMAGSPSDGTPDYRLKPATFTNSSTIYGQDVIVAQVKRGLLPFQPDYRITVFPGIDYAMAVLLVTIYDDLRPSSNGGGAAGGGGGGGGGGACGGGG